MWIFVIAFRKGSELKKASTILYSSAKIQNPSGAHLTRQSEVLQPEGNATSEGRPACTVKNKEITGKSSQS